MTRRMDKRGEYGGAMPARPDEKMGRLREYPFSNAPHRLSSAMKGVLKHTMRKKRRQRDRRVPE